MLKKSVLFKFTSIAFVLVLVSVFFTGCRWTPFGKDFRTGREPVEGEVSNVYGEPWPNSVAYGMVALEEKPSLKDDFYAAVNFDWLSNLFTDEGISIKNVFTENAHTINDRVKNLITGAKDTQKTDADLNKLYNLYIDFDKRNEYGVSDAKTHADTIENISDINSLNNYLQSEESYIYGASLFNLEFDYDYEDPSYYSFVITPVDLSLQDAYEYSKRSDYGDRLYDYYKNQAEYMLLRIGYSKDEAKDIIEDYFEFENDMAKYIKPLEYTSSDEYISSVMNPRSIDELAKESDTFPIADILDGYGFGECNHLYLAQPEWLKGLNELYDIKNIDKIKNYLLVSELISYMDISDEESMRKKMELSKNLSDLDFSWNDTYSGEESDSDLEVGVRFVKLRMPYQVGKAYAKEYLTNSEKTDIEQIGEMIAEGYKSLISKSDVISKSTKESALAKLDNIKIKSLFPDFDKEGNDLSFSYDDTESLSDAVKKIERFEWDRKLNMINKKADNDIRYDDLLQSSVRYLPQQNSIYVYAGAIGDNIYTSSDTSYEQKLGALGMQIASAMAHCIVLDGSGFDENGKINNWWSNEDKESYTENVNKLKDYFDKVIPFADGTHYSGNLVGDMAACDISGMQAVMEAASQIDNFDYDLFFRAYATSLRCVMKENIMEQTAVTNVYPLDYLRINVTASQMDDFYNTYEIDDNDGMYTAPSDRILMF